MKTISKILCLVLGVAFLAGCASKPCKCSVAPAAAAPVTQVAAQPAQPVAESAPVAEPAEEKVPLAVRK